MINQTADCRSRLNLGWARHPKRRRVSLRVGALGLRSFPIRHDLSAMDLLTMSASANTVIGRATASLFAISKHRYRS